MMIILLKRLDQGLENGSVVKSASYSCKGPEFASLYHYCYMIICEGLLQTEYSFPIKPCVQFESE